MKVGKYRSWNSNVGILILNDANRICMSSCSWLFHQICLSASFSGREREGKGVSGKPLSFHMYSLGIILTPVGSSLCIPCWFWPLKHFRSHSFPLFSPNTLRDKLLENHTSNFLTSLLWFLLAKDAKNYLSYVIFFLYQFWALVVTLHQMSHVSLETVWASLVVQLVKNLPAMQEIWVWSLGWEDPMEKGPATHSSILAWRILGRKESDTTEWLSLTIFSLFFGPALHHEGS